MEEYDTLLLVTVFTILFLLFLLAAINSTSILSIYNNNRDHSYEAHEAPDSDFYIIHSCEKEQLAHTEKDGQNQ